MGRRFAITAKYVQAISFEITSFPLDIYFVLDTNEFDYPRRLSRFNFSHRVTVALMECGDTVCPLFMYVTSLYEPIATKAVPVHANEFTQEAT